MQRIKVFVAKGKAEIISTILPKSNFWHQRTFLYNEPEDPDHFYIDFDAQAGLIPEDAVDHVEFSDKLSNFFRLDGIYRNEGAVLMARSTFVHHAEGGLWPAQEIHITGPTIRSAQLIYSLFRSGLLEPSENWTADAIRLQDL